MVCYSLQVYLPPREVVVVPRGALLDVPPLSPSVVWGHDVRQRAARATHQLQRRVIHDSGHGYVSEHLHKSPGQMACVRTSAQESRSSGMCPNICTGVQVKWHVSEHLHKSPGKVECVRTSAQESRSNGM